MAQQYFNERQCVEFYKRFTQDGDHAALDSLLEQCVHMCQWNAIRIAPGQQELIDDLVQIGLVRILELCHQHRYLVGRGKLFSFLTTATRNKMLDFTKLAENQHLHFDESEDEDGEHYTAIGDMPISDEGGDARRIEQLRQRTAVYAGRRFPSLRPEIASEAAHYLIDHLLECSSPALPQKRSIRQTLQACWRIDKWHIIPAVKLHFCLNLVGRPCYEDDAIWLIETLPTREWTSQPEIMLASGRELYNLMQFCMNTIIPAPEPVKNGSNDHSHIFTHTNGENAS